MEVARKEQVTKDSRPMRPRRQHRRPYGEEKRPAKRLFTPEIKRFLKEWLVRRRDNPYPNRDEKKSLALQTGLTYIQVCNWFANWRRKLKNAGKEPQRMTWSHLIKKYNSQAQGNVEHFSICSEDSIWHELEDFGDRDSPDSSPCSATMDHSYTVPNTTLEDDFPMSAGSSKYKNHIMEKYLKDLNICRDSDADDMDSKNKKQQEESPRILSKWLQSAANFRPRQKNYVDWDYGEKKIKHSNKINGHRPISNAVQNGAESAKHGREELDAAEALTRLACAHAVKRVILITAPRRFGKSTNMDMVKKFVEIQVGVTGTVIDEEKFQNYKIFKDEQHTKRCRVGISYFATAGLSGADNIKKYMYLDDHPFVQNSK